MFEKTKLATSQSETKYNEYTLSTQRKLVSIVKVSELNCRNSQLERWVKTLIKQINETLTSVNNLFVVCNLHLLLSFLNFTKYI